MSSLLSYPETGNSCIHPKFLPTGVEKNLRLALKISTLQYTCCVRTLEMQSYANGKAAQFQSLVIFIMRLTPASSKNINTNPK